jgi:hypothetical protein
MMVSSQLFYSSCQLSCLDRSVVVSQEVLMVVVGGDFFVASDSRSCVLVLSAGSVCNSFSCRSGRFHFWNRAVAQFLGPLFFSKNGPIPFLVINFAAMILLPFKKK